MIDGFIQPRMIQISEDLSLVKYYPYYRRTLPWYQDIQVCRQVDNTDQPYDLEHLKQMYRYLSSKGECWYIKLSENGHTNLVGDITLWDGMIAIVICREYQNRHIGRRAICAVLARAEEIGLDHADAEIYSFNLQSRKCFESVGFRQIGEERFRFTLRENEHTAC